MDEEITIIDTNTRNEKIKNFLINNKKNFIVTISIIIILLIGYFAIIEFKKKQIIQISNQYNEAVIDYTFGKKEKVLSQLNLIINKKDKTYSPLALYFIIDNDLLKDKQQINIFFDLLINETNLENEIRNLIIYKKALFNSNFLSANEILVTLNPILKSKSIWKSHALYLMAEYFYEKNEKQKSKEFYNQIVNLENSNTEIKIEAEKRLNRDLSE
jgi:hypothetical protein